MKLIEHRIHKALLSLSVFIFCACGENPTTAEVTLITGLENHKLPNLMDSFVASTALMLTTTITSCKQGQIMAAWGPPNNNGTPNLSNYPVTLTTPGYEGFASLSTPYGAAGIMGWLQASTLAPIKIPAPIGVPVEFGILGSLNVTNQTSDGTTCDETLVHDSVSLEGHASTIISGPTLVPIKLWVIPSTGTNMPNPTSTTCDTSNGGGGTLAQICPNLNFSKMTCASCTTPTTAKLEYFFGNNGNQHITQLVSTSAIPYLIPSIKPVTVTYNSVTQTLNGGGSSTLSVSGATFTFNEGSGVSGIPTKLEITGTTNTAQNACIPLTVRVITITGALATLASPTTFTVGCTGTQCATGVFYSDSGCSSSIGPSSVISAPQGIGSGNSPQTTVYYKNTFGTSTSVSFTASGSYTTSSGFTLQIN